MTPLSEQAAIRAEATLRALIDTMVDGLMVIDREGHVRSYNAACERIFGYAAAEVLGRNVSMLMPSPDRERHDAYLSNYLRTGQRRIIGIGREVRGRRKDGTVFPMELSVGEAVSGEEALFVGIVRDITDRHRADAALREREERLRSILETVPDAVVVIDERGLIDEFSPSAERLFGYSAAEMIGRNVNLLMPSPYRERHDAYIENYLRSGVRRIIGIGRVVVGLRRDGSTFPMELSVGEARTGRGRLFTGFVRDLTERQAAETRFQDLQAELLHVSRLSAMGQMSSALAHELNQPLTAILNYVRAARRLLEAAGDVPPRVLETMDKAVTQTSRAGQIIRRLRDFVEKGHTYQAPDDLNKTVEEASALALVGAKDTGIKVALELDHHLPRVRIDRVQIQQVLLNLVRNSIEAMAQSERRELVIRTAGAGAFAEVTVADTGPGLPEQVAAQLFQPFVTTKPDGMGVGLSISRTIVDAHGGRMWADPEPGGGVAFRFTLPIADTEEENTDA